MKYLLLLALFMGIETAQAQMAITRVDSTPVYTRPNTNSEIVEYLPKGTSIETTKLYGLMDGIMVKSDLGYLLVKDLIFSDEPIKVVSKRANTPEQTYLLKLLQKDPAELTEKEVYYLMLNEMRKDDSLRKDIKTIKNVQVFFAVLTGVSLVLSIIVVAGS